MTFNEEDRKWFFDELQKNGYNTGKYDDFKKSMNDDTDRDWYYKELKNMGYDVGSPEEFKGMVYEGTVEPRGTAAKPAADAAGTVAGTVIPRHPADVTDEEVAADPLLRNRTAAAYKHWKDSVIASGGDPDEIVQRESAKASARPVAAPYKPLYTEDEYQRYKILRKGGQYASGATSTGAMSIMSQPEDKPSYEQEVIDWSKPVDWSKMAANKDAETKRVAMDLRYQQEQMAEREKERNRPFVPETIRDQFRMQGYSDAEIDDQFRMNRSVGQMYDQAVQNIVEGTNLRENIQKIWDVSMAKATGDFNKKVENMYDSSNLLGRSPQSQIGHVASLGMQAYAERSRTLSPDKLMAEVSQITSKMFATPEFVDKLIKEANNLGVNVYDMQKVIEPELKNLAAEMADDAVMKGLLPKEERDYVVMGMQNNLVMMFGRFLSGEDSSYSQAETRAYNWASTGRDTVTGKELPTGYYDNTKHTLKVFGHDTGVSGVDAMITSNNFLVDSGLFGMFGSGANMLVNGTLLGALVKREAANLIASGVSETAAKAVIQEELAKAGIISAVRSAFTNGVSKRVIGNTLASYGASITSSGLVGAMYNGSQSLVGGALAGDVDAENVFDETIGGFVDFAALGFMGKAAHMPKTASRMKNFGKAALAFMAEDVTFGGTSYLRQLEEARTPEERENVSFCDNILKSTIELPIIKMSNPSGWAAKVQRTNVSTSRTQETRWKASEAAHRFDAAIEDIRSNYTEYKGARQYQELQNAYKAVMADPTLDYAQKMRVAWIAGGSIPIGHPTIVSVKTEGTEVVTYDRNGSRISTRDMGSEKAAAKEREKMQQAATISRLTTDDMALIANSINNETYEIDGRPGNIKQEDVYNAVKRTLQGRANERQKKIANIVEQKANEMFGVMEHNADIEDGATVVFRGKTYTIDIVHDADANYGDGDLERNGYVEMPFVDEKGDKRVMFVSLPALRADGYMTQMRGEVKADRDKIAGGDNELARQAQLDMADAEAQLYKTMGGNIVKLKDKKPLTGEVYIVDEKVAEIASDPYRNDGSREAAQEYLKAKEKLRGLDTRTESAVEEAMTGVEESLKADEYQGATDTPEETGVIYRATLSMVGGKGEEVVIIQGDVDNGNLLKVRRADGSEIYVSRKDLSDISVTNIKDKLSDIRLDYSINARSNINADVMGRIEKGSVISVDDKGTKAEVTDVTTDPNTGSTMLTYTKDGAFKVISLNEALNLKQNEDIEARRVQREEAAAAAEADKVRAENEKYHLAVGEKVKLSKEDEPLTVKEISEDGKTVTLTDGEEDYEVEMTRYKQLVDEAKEGNEEAAEPQTKEAVKAEVNTEIIPLGEDGNVDVDRTTPSLAYDVLERQEKGSAESIADTYIAELEKQQKDVEALEIEGNSIQERLQSYRDKTAKKEAVQKALDFWKAVKMERNKRKAMAVVESPVEYIMTGSDAPGLKRTEITEQLMQTAPDILEVADIISKETGLQIEFVDKKEIEYENNAQWTPNGLIRVAIDAYDITPNGKAKTVSEILKAVFGHEFGHELMYSNKDDSGFRERLARLAKDYLGEARYNAMLEEERKGLQGIYDSRAEEQRRAAKTDEERSKIKARKVSLDDVDTKEEATANVIGMLFRDKGFRDAVLNTAETEEPTRMESLKKRFDDFVMKAKYAFRHDNERYQDWVKQNAIDKIQLELNDAYRKSVKAYEASQQAEAERLRKEAEEAERLRLLGGLGREPDEFDAILEGIDKKLSGIGQNASADVVAKKAKAAYEGIPEAQDVFDRMEPETPEEYVSGIGARTLLLDDLVKEIGGTKADWNRLGLTSPTGKTIAAMAHSLWEGRPNASWDDVEIANALRSVLQSAKNGRDMRRTIINNRLEEARQIAEGAMEFARQQKEDAIYGFSVRNSNIKLSLRQEYQKKTFDEMDSGKVPFNGKLLTGDKESKFKVIDDEKKIFTNWYGTKQQRYQKNVGKPMGGGVYVHKNYATDIVPEDIYNKAVEVANANGFEFVSVYYEKKNPNIVRFDSSPDFDTAREPIVGDYIKVDTNTGEIVGKGHSDQIWHNKWMWVKDDYQGFDVDKAYEWSKTWNQKITNPDGWSYKWDYLLNKAGLPSDWTGSALGDGSMDIKFSTAKKDVDDAIAEMAKQDFGSAGTSINSNKLPTGFGLVDKVGGFVEGKTNMDMGGGRFDNATEMLAGKGVTNMVFDPFNRSKEHNREVAKVASTEGFDTVTCNNCLNVINTKGARSNVILQCAKALKPGGTAYFTIYEGNKSGVGKVSKADCWQENRKTGDYLGEIAEHFGDVQKKGQLIIAKEPDVEGKVSIWNYDAEGSENMKFSSRKPEDDVKRMVEKEGVSDETAKVLTENGLTIDGGVTMNTDAASLKAESGYKTPLEPLDEPGAKYSYRTKGDWMDIFLNNRSRSISKERKKEITAAVDAWYERAAADDIVSDYMDYGDYADNMNKDGVGPLRGNVEYGFTFDLDTTCPRTYVYLNFADEIERRTGRPLTLIEAQQLIEAMRAYGYMIPCTYCYAENKRQAVKNYMNRFMDHRQRVLNSKDYNEAFANMYGVEKKTDKEGNETTTITDAARKKLDIWYKKEGINAWNPTIEQLTKLYNQARNVVLTDLDMMKANGEMPKDVNDDVLTKILCNKYGISTDKSASAEDKGRMARISNIVNEWRYDDVSGKQHHNYQQMSGMVKGRLDAMALFDEMSKYAASASSAHNAVRYFPYTSQLNDAKVVAQKKFINAMGGLRMHSTNDFRIDYVGDYFQLIADMAQGGWFGHTYTKSEDFVKIFGDTGYRINMSLAAYDKEYQEGMSLGRHEYVVNITDKYGNRKKVVVMMNPEEGHDWDVAQNLRSNFKNAGSMFMTTSQAQLSYALNADWIDMIIPFHSSGLPKEVMDIRAWEDAQSVQNEKFKNSTTMKAELIANGVTIPKGAKADDVKKLYKKTFGIKTVFDNTKDMKDELKAAGVSIPTGSKYEDIKKLYKDTFGHDCKAKGKAVRPHFLPGEQTIAGVKIPGWKTDANGNELKTDAERVARYMELCNEYGVMPRFYGLKCNLPDGTEVDVTRHPNYIKVLKETARMDTPQEAIQFNLDQPSKPLGINPATGDYWTPMDWAFNQIREQHGTIRPEDQSEDKMNLIPDFIKNVMEYKKATGMDRPINYLSPTARWTWNYLKAGQDEARREAIMRTQQDEWQYMGVPYHPGEIKLSTRIEKPRENTSEENEMFRKLADAESVVRYTERDYNKWAEKKKSDHEEMQSFLLQTIEQTDDAKQKAVLQEAYNIGQAYVVPTQEEHAKMISDAEATIADVKPLYDARQKEWTDYYDAVRAEETRKFEEAEAIRKKTKPVYAEFTPEEEAANAETIKKAKKEFGTTTDFREAGYILTDGTMLDFSEKKQGGERGRRSLDHRSIGRVVDGERWEAVTEFMHEGNIRIMPESGTIDLGRKPTAKQMSKIGAFVRVNDGDVCIEFYDDSKNSEHYVEYEGARYQRVIADINRYFDEGIRPEGNIKFSNRIEKVDPFYSNAAKAVEGIKMDKATPEQWLKMIEKAGGLKKEEDKWMGLSEWLKKQQAMAVVGERGKTVTRQEVMDFIAENSVKVEEVSYAEPIHKPSDELKEMGFWQDDDNTWRNSYDGELVIRREDDKYYVDYAGSRSTRSYDTYEEAQEEAYIALDSAWGDMVSETENENDRPIHGTRLAYTTQGLTNKREIALIVPTVEAYRAEDDIHFGDAGEGRAVAWLRFGDAVDGDGKKVLVVDEIQSKRHQDGREKGYRDKDVRIQYREWKALMQNKYGANWIDKLTVEEFNKGRDLERQSMANAESPVGVPDAPFRSNWHELAMKRALRYAAENGYDKVAWTTGAQQAERYNIGHVVDEVWHMTDKNHFNFQKDGYSIGSVYVDKDGIITKGNRIFEDQEGQHISEIIGKDLSKTILASEPNDEIPINGMIGGEGMKGFYDNMLVKYMSKYGKKWGAKVGEAELDLPNEADRVMHSVDVTPEMKESVMGGQPMFSTRKEQQLDIIRKSNPKDEKLGDHTWIESVDDIKTFDEAVKEEWAGTPDFTLVDAAKALKSGKVKVYSSYPIKNGVFVTPSKMEAQNYAGSGKVYEKVMNLDDVAWIDSNQGQVTVVPEVKYSKRTEEAYATGRDASFINKYGEEEIMKIHKDASIIEDIEPLTIKPHSYGKEELRKMYREFTPVDNDDTDERIVFYAKGFEKNYRVGGNFEKVVPYLPEIAKTAVLAYSQPDNLAGKPRKDGTLHKEHPKYLGFGNYINKVDIDGEDYYVRLVVQREVGRSGLHSTMVTAIDLYRNPTNGEPGQPLSGKGELDISRISDAKLQKYFELAKENEDNLSDNVKLSVRGAIGANEEEIKMLDQAKAMLEKYGDKPSDDVRRMVKMATGWEQGADGKWRLESEDFPMPNRKAHPTTLGEAYPEDHVLLKSYPALRDIELDYSKRTASAGCYKGDEGKITISKEIWAGEYGDNYLQRVMQHEVQHAIQHIEGFARGGNSTSMKQLAFEDLKQRQPDTYTYIKALGDLTSYKNLKLFGKDWAQQLVGQYKDKYSSGYQEAMNALYKKLKGMTEDEYKAFVDNAKRESTKITKAGNKGYNNLAGEVESRNVEKRMDMPMEDRMSSLLSDTEDVAREQQIVKFSNRGNNDEARKQMVTEIRHMMDNERISAMQKSDLNKLLNRVKFVTEDNLLDQITKAKSVMRDIDTKILGKQLADIMNLKIQDRNGRNMSIAKNVDNTTRLILGQIKKQMYGLTNSEADERMHVLRSQNWHLRDDNRFMQGAMDKGQYGQEGDPQYEEKKSMIEANNAQIEANKAEINALESERREYVAEALEVGSGDVERDLADLTQKMIDACEPDSDVEFTEEDKAMLTSLELLKQRIAIEQLDQELSKWQKQHANAETAQERKALETTIENVKQERYESLKNLVDDIQDVVENGKDALRRRRADEISHRAEIVRGAMSDVAGKRGANPSHDPHLEEGKKQGKIREFVDNLVLKSMATLKSFAYMCEDLDRNHMAGDGFLTQYFMKSKHGVMEANNNYLRGVNEATDKLQKKTKEIFGGDMIKTAADGKEVSQDHGITVVIDEKDDAGNTVGLRRVDLCYKGNTKPMPLSKNEATYLYMVWQMPDGRAKMEYEGFDEQSIAEIEQYIGADRVAWADYVQQEYLPELFKKYNAKYLEIFGTSMKQNENYVPMRYDTTSLPSSESETLMNGEQTGNNIQKKNSFTINRTLNTLPVSKTTDCFDVVLDHVREAEEFTAFADVRRDLDAIIGSRAFRTQVERNGKGQYQAFIDACKVATRNYRDGGGAVDRWLNWVTRGLVGANIAFRVGTALKQVTSVPAFIAYSNNLGYQGHLVKNIFKGYFGNIIGMAGGSFAKETLLERRDEGKYSGFTEDFKWALDNIPSFRNRLKVGDIGNEILQMDGNTLRAQIMQHGMYANQMVDAVTCLVGIKSVYDYNMNKARKEIDRLYNEGEITDEERTKRLKEAHRAACMEADICYNSSQQSSNEAFLSPIQASQNFLYKALMAYKNSPVSYARHAVLAAKDLAKLKDYGKVVNSYAKTYELTGYSADEARAMAKKQVRKRAFESLSRLSWYGLFLGAIWQIAGKGVYGLYMDDDQKDELLSVATLMKSVSGGGVPVWDAATGLVSGDGYDFMLASQEFDQINKDIERLKKEIGEDPYWGKYDAAITAMQKLSRFYGVDLETAGNLFLGIEEMIRQGMSEEEIDARLNMEYIINLSKTNRKSSTLSMYADESAEDLSEDIAKASKYFTVDDWRRYVPGAKTLDDKKFNDIAKTVAGQKGMVLGNDDEQTDAINKMNTEAELKEAYSKATDEKTRKKILDRAKKLAESDGYNFSDASWEQRFQHYVDKKNGVNSEDKQPKSEKKIAQEEAKKRKNKAQAIFIANSNEGNSQAEARIMIGIASIKDKESAQYKRMLDWKKDYNGLKESLADTKWHRERIPILKDLADMRHEAEEMLANPIEQ